MNFCPTTGENCLKSQLLLNTLYWQCVSAVLTASSPWTFPLISFTNENTALGALYK